MTTLDSKKHSPLSPKFAGAIFFAIYMVLFLLFTKYTLLPLREKTLLPFLPSILIAIIIGAIVGALLGKVLAKKSPWFRPFLIGILLAILVLILSTLAILIPYLKDPIFVSRLHQWQDYFIVYGAILLSLCVTIGVWFIPLTGLIAIYFNKQFWPGLVAADQQRMQNENQSKPEAPNDE